MSTEDTKQELDVRRGKPSASGLHRLVACPGSWMAEQLAGTDEETEYARHGTELHAHMENGTSPADAEDADAVAWCRETEGALAERFVGAGGDCVRESRLWDAQGRFSGQADAVFFSADGTKALVVDYKFGRGEVDGAERNYQLAALAVLCRDAYPALVEVYAAILQPFASRQEPKTVKYTRGSLDGAARAIYGAIDAAEKPDAALRASVLACKYCKAARTCPACSGHALACSAVKRWDSLSLPARAELYQRAKQAKKLAEKVEAAVRADLEAGVELPGLKLGEGRTSFTVTDAAGAFGVVSANLGVTPAEFTACCKVQISTLDKLAHEKLKARRPEQRVADSKEELRAMLAGYGESKTTAGTIKEIELLG